MHYESHLSDQDLLLAADGELSPSRATEVAKHLERCWSCRARKQELEDAVVDFVRLYPDELDSSLPPSAGPRALLRAQLDQVATVRAPWWTRLPHLFDRRYAVAGGVLAILLAASYQYWIGRPHLASRAAPALPVPGLTPGAVVRIDREQVCRSNFSKNQVVPVALQRKVFEEYGIQGARPDSYEVDYLITPALGGADDIRNLWPQSYSAAVWNARVKDALEDRLRDLVCEGDLELAVAQREIASDWIAAYKKYFHTDRPLDLNR